MESKANPMIPLDVEALARTVATEGDFALTCDPCANPKGEWLHLTREGRRYASWFLPAVEVTTHPASEHHALRMLRSAMSDAARGLARLEEMQDEILTAVKDLDNHDCAITAHWMRQVLALLSASEGKANG